VHVCRKKKEGQIIIKIRINSNYNVRRKKKWTGEHTHKINIKTELSRQR
jgi:hypothetical protein